MKLLDKKKSAFQQQKVDNENMILEATTLKLKIKYANKGGTFFEASLS